jgi:D-threo-aldose 1-dehydrogenase
MDPFQTKKIGDTGLEVTRLGLGGATLGDASQSDSGAVAAIHRAFGLGTGYVDTSPVYGNGRSEMRFGRALADVLRDSYVISTKVGRLLKLNGTEEVDFKNLTLEGLPQLTEVFDFSRDAILRSVDQSLDRLSLERVDILYLHDVPEEHFEQAIVEAAPALAELRAEGRVSAIGAGLGNLDLLVGFAREADFDCFILPWRYTLMDQSALAEFLPLCMEKGISIVMGAPYDTGGLFGRRSRTPEYTDKLRRINGVCDLHEVPVKAAALQFVAAHPATVSVIPGPASVHEVEDNVQMMQHPTPPEFWEELRHEGLIAPGSPTPNDNG